MLCSVGYSLLDIVKEIELCTQRNAELIFESKRGFDVKEVVLDISLAKEQLNWSPECSLQDGVKLHYEWLVQASNSSEI